MTALAKRQGLIFAERAELERRRASILARLDSMDDDVYAIGVELLHIQRKGLWREHPTWEAFCRDLFGRSRRWAQRCIRLVQVTEALGAAPHVTPAIADELAALPKELQQVAYDLAGGEDATARSAREARAVLQAAADKLAEGGELDDAEIDAINSRDRALRAAAEKGKRLAPVHRISKLLERVSKTAAKVDAADVPALGLLQVELLADLEAWLPETAAKALRGELVKVRALFEGLRS